MWRTFLGSGGRVRHTPQDRRELEVAQVFESRSAMSRYPSDQRLRCLVAGSTREQSPVSGAVGRHVAAHKTVDHPQVGALTLDCDLLSVAGSELRILVYTAEPDTEDAERLALLTEIGTQALVG
ncbi:hypothetical protein [Streptomyces natalensis]|uniref:MmyB family transcriptional regulator n=1 Tax=Streptomyces natalensis TaxID=68242 RepID=UPI00068A5175